MRARAWALAHCLAVLAAASAARADVPMETPVEQPVIDSDVRYFLLVDQLEYREHDGDGGHFAAWEIDGWVGGDYNRVWLRSEGDRSLTESEGEAELEILYGRLISPFWDFTVGVRQDLLSGGGHDRGRTFLSIGLEGLAPYWFEVTPAFYLSDDGDVSARLEATYDLLLSQRLVLQPRFELEAGTDAREFGIGGGLQGLQLGARLRYEIRRELAPYVGVNWTRRLGKTAELTRDEGEDANILAVVAGIRLWF